MVNAISTVRIPPWLHFFPSDEELIEQYLIKKVAGQHLPPGFVIDRDLYGSKSPWEVLYHGYPWEQTVPGDNTKMSVYVFTKLKFLGKQSQNRIARACGCGTWHGEPGSQDIVIGTTGAIIGKKKMFSFRTTNERFKGQKGHWYMPQGFELLDEDSFASLFNVESVLMVDEVDHQGWSNQQWTHDFDFEDYQHAFKKMRTGDDSELLKVAAPNEKTKEVKSTQEAPQFDQSMANNDTLVAFSYDMDRFWQEISYCDLERNPQQNQFDGDLESLFMGVNFDHKDQEELDFLLS